MNFESSFIRVRKIISKLLFPTRAALTKIFETSGDEARHENGSPANAIGELVGKINQSEMESRTFLDKLG